MEATTEKPNVLFVLTDDMPESLLGSLLSVREELVRKGVRFRNAYVTQSLCCPSRATMLTGRHPHNNQGVVTNESPEGGEPRFRELGRDDSMVATWGSTGRATAPPS